MPIEQQNHLAQHTYTIVLAGGRGSRLAQLTDHRSKPAVPFAGKFRIIDFALSNCVNSGLRRIGVLTQYKSQSLIRHIERGWGFLAATLGEFVEIVPAQQQQGESWYRGTANAVFQNLELVRESAPRYVLVLGGDHVYKMDYSVMLAEHVRRGAAASVACLDVPLEEAREFGVMAAGDDGRVTSFDEKPERPRAIPGRPRHALASMGIYLFDAEVLYAELARDAATKDSRHDFGHDVIPALVRAGRVHAHRFETSCVNVVDGRPYWRDVGTVDAYWAANMDLTRVVPELNLYDEDWPILSLQRQLPPAKFVFDDEGRRGMAVDSLVSGGAIVSGATVRRSILFSNARVGDGSVVEDSVVLPNVVIGRGVRLARTVIDKHCRVPDGFKAGFDAERDRARGLHVTTGGITLVTPQMLGQ
ncbi:MAG: glucose-1-phosphate adenylyltransferase [Betaproteobacteria bacterium]|nr:glucose-1-phosphate adenylyltransferase [Betaproteobacteria bacterium]MCC6250465.1 glucose-1-phosphate adenylyltransferase [Rubrivivax sp.]MCL4697588.1 glucose-1-phosphate adenylyltransferase [Burkholderiaceae bacterium]